MLAQIAALYPNVTVSVSNKRQAFDLTYNNRLIWNGSSMGPPRALKVCSCFIDDDDGCITLVGAAADYDDNEWLCLCVLPLQNLTFSSLIFSSVALLQLPWQKPSSSIGNTEFTCCTCAQQPLQALVNFPKIIITNWFLSPNGQCHACVTRVGTIAHRATPSQLTNAVFFAWSRVCAILSAAHTGGLRTAVEAACP